MLQVILIGVTQHRDSVLNVATGSYEIRFSDYVKSQIHLSIANILNRDIKDYVNAYLFLKGDKSKSEDAKKVLMFFYKDISRFLMQNTMAVSVYIDVDASLDLKEESFNVAGLENELGEVLNKLISLSAFEKSPDFDEDTFAKIVQNSLYYNTLCSIQDYDDFMKKQRNYAISAALQTCIAHNSIIKLNKEELDGYHISKG